MQLFCSNCNGTLFTPQSNIDNSVILEKLRWESGPASVPEPDEVAPILQNARRDLEEYEQEIHKLDSRRSFLTAQRDRLRDTIFQARALLSPVRKVPDEILRHIFDDRCDTNHFEFDPASRENGSDVSGMEPNASDIPALALSSVCSRWRRVGLAFPNIWARISLKVVCYDGDSLQQNTQLLENFSNLLSRSQQWPLSVTIDMSKASVEITNLECSALFVLVREYPRWKEFSFYSNGWCELQGLFPASGISLETLGEFPKLIELALYVPYTNDTTEDDVDFFAHRVPNLRVFKSHDIPEMPSAFPLAQLLHFKLDPDDMVIQQTGELSRSTRLISLDVNDFVKDLGAIDISSISPITSSTIEVLTVRHEFRHGVAFPMRSILRFLTCPSLNTLHLDSSSSSICVDFEQLMEFLKRSSFRLTTLSIKSLSLSDSDLLSLLACTPTLLDLTLNDTYTPCANSPITSRLINSLHAYQTGSQSVPLVPRLQHLYLNLGARSFKDEAVVEMVKSRWTLGHTMSVAVDRLRSFTVIFRRRGKVLGTYDALDDIEMEGMRVAVMWKGEHGQLIF